jgi:hypothetical protein
VAFQIKDFAMFIAAWDRRAFDTSRVPPKSSANSSPVISPFERNYLIYQSFFLCPKDVRMFWPGNKRTLRYIDAGLLSPMSYFTIVFAGVLAGCSGQTP